MSPKEIVMRAIAEIHFGQGVSHKDIIRTLKNCIEEIENIEE